VAGLTVLAARVTASDVSALRDQIDPVREAAGSHVVVLGTVIDSNPRLVAFVTAEGLARGVNASMLIKQLAAVIGGAGGGRPSIAEAGGKDAGRLDEALAGVPRIVADLLGAQGSAARAQG